MGLSLRVTFEDRDYVYQIIDSKQINNTTTEIKLLVDGENVELIRDKKLVWTEKTDSPKLNPGLVQALGRSVSLRLRM